RVLDDSVERDVLAHDDLSHFGSPFMALPGRPLPSRSRSSRRIMSPLLLRALPSSSAPCLSATFHEDAIQLRPTRLLENCWSPGPRRPVGTFRGRAEERERVACLP